MFGIVCLFLAVPLFVNFLSSIPAPFKSWELPSVWTVFWGQYLSGCASIAMLYVAWKSLLEAREVNRPYIIVDMVEKKGAVYIRCRNIGNSTAHHVKLSMTGKIFDSIQIDKIKAVIASIDHQSDFMLEPNGKKLFELFLIPCSYNDMLYGYQYSRVQAYPFKGENISRDSWLDNEKIFQSDTIECNVTYNTFSDKFILDYNNRDEDIDAAKYVSDHLMGISFNLANVKEELRGINEKLNPEKTAKR